MACLTLGTQFLAQADWQGRDVFDLDSKTGVLTEGIAWQISKICELQ